MNITMEGEYAYAKDPYTKVRILCVDRPTKYAPIISLDVDGYICIHREDGSNYPLTSTDHNLVPLKKKPVERWAVSEANGCFVSTYEKEGSAKHVAEQIGGRYFLMREVEE